MKSITIHHCRLRIVRRGGWDWGASRRELADRAVRVLPELIARRLGGLLPEARDLEIAAPLRLGLSLTRRQFLEAVVEGDPLRDVPTSGEQTLVSRLDAAIRQQLLPGIEQHARGAAVVDETPRTAAEPTDSPIEAQPRAPALLKLLAAWWKQGELGLLLRYLSTDTLTVWHEAVCRMVDVAGLDFLLDSGQHISGGEDSDERSQIPGRDTVEAIVKQISQTVGPEADVAGVVRARIVAAMGVLCRLKRAPGDADVPAADMDDALEGVLARIVAATELLCRLERAPWDADVRATGMDDALKGVRARTVTATEVLCRLERAPGDADVLAAGIDDAPERVCAGIGAATEVNSQLGLPSADDRVQAALTRHLPVDHGTAAAAAAKASCEFDVVPSDERVEPDGVSEASGLPPRSSLPCSRVSQIGQADVHVRSALPFVLLGPLGRIGYLDTIAASLEAAGLNQFAPALAAALAYKVLDPPQRGWQRDAETRRTAAAFAGVTEDVPETLLTRLAQQADSFVSAPNALLARAVLRGHDVKQPLLVSHVASGQDTAFVVTDTDGIFPAARCDTLNELEDILRLCESSLLLVDAGAANPEVLAELHREGFRFLIDVPPTRGEKWRRVRDRRGGRWWTNDAVTSASKLSRFGARLSDWAEAVSRFWDGVQEQRPAFPRADDPQLDHALTFAAGVSLAQIAWDLWRDREPTGPLLTLERFRDLDARVQFRQEKVRVVLPLGRRSMDLAEHGLLENVVGVPWFGNRVLSFSKG